MFMKGDTSYQQMEKAFCEEERMNEVICDDGDGDKRK